MNDTSGTQFDFTYAPGTSAEQILGFEMAGEIWSSYLSDDVTINIYVESTNELPEDVIGAALPGKKKKEKFEKVKGALADDATSTDDQLAVANLPAEDKEFGILVDGQELDKTKEFRLTNANAKSLGLLNEEQDKLDGYILVNDLTSNSDIAWDYDPLRSDGIQGNEVDFLSVAMHEIGHILGFVSGIDDDEWLNVLTESEEEDKEIKDKDFKFASTLDLYRYSDSSPSSGEIDLSVGGNPYFSIDGGNTNLGSFANGEYTQFGGDGYQASHWEQNSSQGVMDPILPVGQRRDISNLDLTAMDVIGWDINTAPSSSWDQMYANALADSETATIENRDDDVDKLVKESDYDVRRSRNASRASYFRQIGFWQYTTIDAVEAPEVIVEDESFVETESTATANQESLEQIQPEPNLTENNDSNLTDAEIVIDEPIVETETENDDTEQIQSASIIETENNLSTDSEALPNDELITNDNASQMQSEAETDEGNQDGIQEDTLETSDDSNDDSQPENLAESSVNQSLNSTNSGAEESDLADNNQVNDLTDSVETENNADELDDEPAEYSNSDWYTLNYQDEETQYQSVTGVADNEQDSLFY